MLNNDLAELIVYQKKKTDLAGLRGLQGIGEGWSFFEIGPNQKILAEQGSVAK